MFEADRWKAWWPGPERPFLVLPSALFSNPETAAIADKEYPGILLVENKMIGDLKSIPYFVQVTSGV